MLSEDEPEAKAGEKQRTENVEERKPNEDQIETERATRDAYLGVNSEISRVRALRQAVESSRTALEATQAGFDVGTRTIVDVLNSQFALYQSITNYYQSRYDYILNVMRL